MLGEYFPLLILLEESVDPALSGAVLSLAVTALCAFVAMPG